MHGATLLGKAGEVLRPCILWNDSRSHAEAGQLDATDGVRDLSGNIVFPGFTAPKLKWVCKNEPEVFKAIDKVLLPAAYLNFYLTGDFVADMLVFAAVFVRSFGCSFVCLCNLSVVSAEGCSLQMTVR